MPFSRANFALTFAKCVDCLRLSLTHCCSALQCVAVRRYSALQCFAVDLQFAESTSKDLHKLLYMCVCVVHVCVGACV